MRARLRHHALTLLTVAVVGCAATVHGAGQYVKVDYPASTNTHELQTAVTYKRTRIWHYGPDAKGSFC